MSKKPNKRSLWTIVLGMVGAAGALASIVALWPAFTSLNQNKNPAATIYGSDNSQVVGTGNTQINDSTIVYGSEVDRTQQFKKPVPRSFLDNLP